MKQTRKALLRRASKFLDRNRPGSVPVKKITTKAARRTG